MPTERTLSIVKPDAVAKGVIGPIVSLLEAGGLRVVAMRMLRWTRPQAEAFYSVHRERPFFRSLVDFMTEGPIVAMVLEGENAIAKNREVMGATDPAKAAEGTIRKRFAANVERNCVHGSDGPDTARVEIGFLFAGMDL
jgi:nucleoside-diphosphate kinase